MKEVVVAKFRALSWYLHGNATLKTETSEI
jgi:hypothetical protein